MEIAPGKGSCGLNLLRSMSSDRQATEDFTMNMKKRSGVSMGLVVFLLAVGWCAGVSSPTYAASSNYELYSWKSGNSWEFSLLPGSNSDMAAVEIKRSGGPLRGTSKVKEKLLNMKEGDVISWQERAKSGMVYPPEPIIEEIADYAKAVGVHITKPK